MRKTRDGGRQWRGRTAEKEGEPSILWVRSRLGVYGLGTRLRFHSPHPRVIIKRKPIHPPVTHPVDVLQRSVENVSGGRMTVTRVPNRSRSEDFATPTISNENSPPGVKVGPDAFESSSPN